MMSLRYVPVVDVQLQHSVPMEEMADCEVGRMITDGELAQTEVEVEDVRKENER